MDPKGRSLCLLRRAAPGNRLRYRGYLRLFLVDEKWMEGRKKKEPIREPMAIYEVHIGSWKKKDRKERDGFYSYKEAAHELAAYVKEMGYTHVELMGIAEHPLDASWGYQVTGYYAPTSRYGSPKEFMYFVNYMHKKGIGVILDWVPAHFPRDAHGLADFDGQPLYDTRIPEKERHPDWGTKIFDYGEKRSEKLPDRQRHVLGRAVPYRRPPRRRVASMLYLDYGRSAGNWVPNQYGENKNLEAIEFFRHLNSVLTGSMTKALMIAEESTAWPGVTQAPEEGGLGILV